MRRRLYTIFQRALFYFKAPKYSIKKGYIHRKSAHNYDDSKNTDEWQKEVYSYARNVAEQYNYSTILDIGCGSGFKFIKYFKDLEIIGVEIEPTLTYLKKKYPDNRWLRMEEITPNTKFDLIILSDVIEHIKYPDKFIEKINNLLIFNHLIISTPERDLTRSENDCGPPTNDSHFREWNSLEFKCFLSPYLDIENQFIVPNKGTTQVILAKRKKVFENNDL